MPQAKGRATDMQIRNVVNQPQSNVRVSAIRNAKYRRKTDKQLYCRRLKRVRDEYAKARSDEAPDLRNRAEIQ
jgi:hypothetical protein